MTKQEALDNVFNDCSLNGDMYQAQWTAIAKWIHKIFDDFENRSCKNCKYWTDNEYCANLVYECCINDVYEDRLLVTASDWYCKEWESKE